MTARTTITRTQRLALNGIESLHASLARAPTVMELAAHLGLERSVLASRLDFLERAGLLEPRQTRSPVPLVLSTQGLRAIGAAIPVLGAIRAGPLEEALEEPKGLLRLPNARPAARDQFALEVEGDSMVDLMFPGDIVLLELPKGRAPREGQIVAARVGEAFETTLKRWHRVGAAVELRAENPRYPPIRANAREIEVLGHYIGRMSPSVAALFLSG
jgi:SOS regulatory protein LexA